MVLIADGDLIERRVREAQQQRFDSLVGLSNGHIQLADPDSYFAHLEDGRLGVCSLSLELPDALRDLVALRLQVVDHPERFAARDVELQNEVHQVRQARVSPRQGVFYGLRLVSEAADVKHQSGGMRRRLLQTGLASNLNVSVPPSTSITSGTSLA